MENFSTNEAQTSFQVQKTTVKGQSNESLFRLIEQAINKKAVQLLLAPHVDVGRYPYYWVGVRYDYNELEFKLLVNKQIMDYIDAYLKGDEQLPTVTEYNPMAQVEDVGEWLQNHEAQHADSSLSSKEFLWMKDGVNYLIKTFTYRNGRISYTLNKFEDTLSLLFGN